MAEQIPFSIIADVLTKLGSSAVQQIGSAFGVSKELTKLTKKLETIKGVLVDAEKRQKESDAVKAWVRRLKDVAYDADDLLDDFEFETLRLRRGSGGVAAIRQVCDFFSSSNQLVFCFKMSNRIKNIKEDIDEIVKEIPMLSLTQGNISNDQPEAESSWRETHSFVLTSEIVGREENKEVIIKLLVSSFDDHNEEREILSMVAIVGIGGLGKTTLAQLVYSDLRVVEYFELKIWVCVSDPFEVKSLVKKILKEVCDQDVERLELNGLKNLLHEKLSHKRCLLVLDDVWNENYEKWDQLRRLLMVVGKGSKILVTTRHSKVASVMGIDSPFVLEGLKGTQPWDLFVKIAFTEASEKMHPMLVEIGKEIVNMCKGVPLIIKTLGSILRMKTEESHWLSIKNNKNLLSLRDGNDNVLPVLRLSYDNLSLPLKLCFEYCALFPKDYKMEKKLLLQLWMAQGFIQPLDESIGDQYFEELLSRSLLEVFEKDACENILSCKMHDLIHDLALSIVGSEVLILEDDVKHISGEVHHVSMFKAMNIELKALKLRHIRTFLGIPLLSSPIYYGHEGVPIQSFSNFKCIRVLSLNGFSIKKVPKSIGKLNHLKYLDLSHNKFKVLPNSITNLKNLQTLKLVDCLNLKELPKDTGELINMRHLENHKCWHLSHMPCGIGKLTKLQSLPLFVVGNRRGGGRLSELKRLNNLRGELRIIELQNVKDVDVLSESREANLGGKEHVRSLELIWRHLHSRSLSGAQSDEDAESVLEGLQPHRNLKKLCIRGYIGRRFPSWMMMNINGGLSSMLPSITTIELEGCTKCQALPCFVRLPHLMSLALFHLPMVEYMEECSSEGPFFPSLQDLFIYGMPKLKELWRISTELPTVQPPPSFPCLTELRIENCADLASLELPPSPLLSRINIKFCYQLASLELHSCPLLYKLEIHTCPKLTFLQLPPSPRLSLLDIASCYKLASLELHSSPLLSKLKIYDCHKLTSLLLPPSPRLSHLDIHDCYELASLKLDPSPLLFMLRIRNCPKLISLQVSSLCCLRTLKLDQLREEILQQLMLLTTLPHWMGNLTCLTYLNILHCPHLTSLPEELGSLRLLQSLTIGHCYSLIALPDRIGNLTSLTYLEIGYCPRLTSLPEGIRSLTTLGTLKIVQRAYPKDAKGKMVKIGPRLLMSDSFGLMDEEFDSEKPLQWNKKFTQELKLIGVHMGLLFMEVSKYLCKRWDYDTFLLSRIANCQCRELGLCLNVCKMSHPVKITSSVRE